MASIWFVRGGRKVYGPLDSAKLKQLAAAGKIDQTTKVAQNQNGPWVPAGKVKGLFEAPPVTPAYAPEPQTMNKEFLPPKLPGAKTHLSLMWHHGLSFSLAYLLLPTGEKTPVSLMVIGLSGGVLMSGGIIYSGMIDPDDVNRQYPTVVGVWHMWLGFLLLTVGVCRLFYLLILQPMWRDHLLDDSVVPEAPSPPSVLSRIAYWADIRLIGEPGSPSRRKHYFKATIGLVCLVGCGIAIDRLGYFVPINIARGRDMSKLNEYHVTYLSPSDARYLPTRHSWSFPKVKQISPATAQMLLENQANRDLSFDGVTAISDMAIYRLAERPGNLSLDGLKQLSDASASYLANHREGLLSLNGVTHLSDRAAQYLTQHNRSVSLRGLKDISAKALSELRSSDRIHLPEGLGFTSAGERAP